jgi:hypothetical protein
VGSIRGRFARSISASARRERMPSRSVAAEAVIPTLPLRAMRRGA